MWNLNRFFLQLLTLHMLCKTEYYKPEYNNKGNMLKDFSVKISMCFTGTFYSASRNRNGVTECQSGVNQQSWHSDFDSGFHYNFEFKRCYCLTKLSCVEWVMDYQSNSTHRHKVRGVHKFGQVQPLFLTF